ncbi:hypothetical protein LOB94_03780 [Lactobacillus delbrueckii subsp. bulgaricus]|uniref:hypothetical protein n=1 Tax=Lactobacillus delbrueckii TaxID=1584 RepID=UPI0004A5CA2A|nr:hypothetical protein [Lactobacillus delbrueckii]MCD5464845.1 hypothetical protein [Lactobacillus delbrueckii subsp. bulgaricus]MCD5482418.1 hypothetical protein [Lactobacillus delbrueckii subsp. bulgaricus]MCD5482470.1 hypothetical protein [Lactobacillus delbrueckii subsp. bulgaricus]MCT3468512.1 hypothetical protein [Lactobacillus delbrueckii subsp. bulgaricus]CDR75509.1 Putative uncharacterized protein ORF112A [Lactobacillus delbrueckii subsp. bulgaricus]
MVKIDWRDVLTKLLPLLPTLLMYWASYRLSQQKNAQEKKRDEFDRLNVENTRLSEDLDRYRKLVAAKEREIVKLQKEIAEMRNYIAGAPKPGALFNKEKEDKNEFNGLA